MEQATLFVEEAIKNAEQVKHGDTCSTELEQRLTNSIDDYKAGRNLYRVLETMRVIITVPMASVCNRRRMMACVNDKCDCYRGTERRELRAPAATYQSYYCYPTSGI